MCKQVTNSLKNSITQIITQKETHGIRVSNYGVQKYNSMYGQCDDTALQNS